MKEFELKDLFKYFCSLSKIFWIILFTIIGFTIGCLIRSRQRYSYFESSTSMILGTFSEIVGTENEETVSQDVLDDRYYYINSSLSLNNNLAATYKNLLYTNNALNKIINELNLDMSTQELSNSIYIGIADGTSIITISVTNKDATIAKLIATKASQVFTEEIKSLYGISNVKILDEAEVSDYEIVIDSSMYVLIFSVIGFFIPVIVILVKFYFDNTLRGDYQIEKSTGLNILGHIQVNAQNKIKYRNIKDYIKGLKNGKVNAINQLYKTSSKASTEIFTYTNPQSPMSEEIKLVNANLNYTKQDNLAKTILITSSAPGEGKSYLAANLAMSLSQTGKKVLLIDSDFRTGRINEMFSVSSKKKGLSDLLLNLDEATNLEDYISGSKLFIMTKGNIKEKSTDLLASDQFVTILKYLKKQFDVIIFDGSAVVGLSDAVIISKLVDSTILVSALGYTPVELLIEAKEMLDKVSANIEGVVINRSKSSPHKNYLKYFN